MAATPVACASGCGTNESYGQARQNMQRRPRRRQRNAPAPVAVCHNRDGAPHRRKVLFSIKKTCQKSGRAFFFPPRHVRSMRRASGCGRHACRQCKRRGRQLAQFLGHRFPAPPLGAPSLPELDPLRQIGEARDDDFCRCCPRGKCLAGASHQAGLKPRPKPTPAGATGITEKGATGKIDDFKVVEDTGVCV